MPEIELSAGTVAYEDTGGEGPVVVLLHGLLQDASVWRHVVAELRTDHRVVAPTLPYGAHRTPMTQPPTPDLVNELIAEFLDRLDLRDVTLVESDCGRAQTVAARHPERLARLVLISCEAFDNYPPGLPGKMIGLACRVPGGVPLMARVLGWKPLRRLPVGFGALTKRPLPDELVERWLRPLRTDPAIRRDLQHACAAHGAAGGRAGVAALRPAGAGGVGDGGPDDAAEAWAHAGRAAAAGAVGGAEGTRTLIAQDRPQRLASLLRWFVAQG